MDFKAAAAERRGDGEGQKAAAAAAAAALEKEALQLARAAAAATAAAEAASGPAAAHSSLHATAICNGPSTSKCCQHGRAGAVHLRHAASGNSSHFVGGAHQPQ